MTRWSAYRVFLKDTATTEIYTLSLHDALPISARTGVSGAGAAAARRSRPAAAERPRSPWAGGAPPGAGRCPLSAGRHRPRSEEHTSELQSRHYLVCRLLLETISFRITCTCHTT